LLQGQKQDPNNPYRLANIMEFYRRTGLAVLRQGRRAEGIARLEKALGYANTFDHLMSADKAVASRFTLSDVLMIKADIEVSLEQWDAAAQSLSRIIDIDAENPNALLNRAIVLTRLKKYPAAKDDAEALRKAMPKEPFVGYGEMVEIARAEKDADAEKKYVRLYLKSAPSDSPQYPAMKKELEKLEAR
jgi:tetratricopeptide (TPR) repeat protein